MFKWLSKQHEPLPQLGSLTFWGKAPMPLTAIWVVKQTNKQTHICKTPICPLRIGAKLHRQESEEPRMESNIITSASWYIDDYHSGSRCVGHVYECFCMLNTPCPRKINVTGWRNELSFPLCCIILVVLLLYEKWLVSWRNIQRCSPTTSSLK